jgi:hypothetical protein
VAILGLWEIGRKGIPMVLKNYLSFFLAVVSGDSENN